MLSFVHQGSICGRGLKGNKPVAASELKASVRERPSQVEATAHARQKADDSF